MAGLAATSPDMYLTADKYMDDNNMYDVDIKSTIGFTAADVEQIASLSVVESAQSAKVLDIVLEGESKSYTARVYSVLRSDYNGDDPKEATKLNKFVLKEGRLPRADDECVIQSPAGKYLGGDLAVGATVTVSHDNADYNAAVGQMAHTTLKVVGLVQSPTCISVTHEPTTVGAGTISLDVYTRDNLFTFDYLTDVYVTLKGAKPFDTFSEEYAEFVDDRTSIFANVGAKCVDERKNELTTQAETMKQLLSDTIDVVAKSVEEGTAIDSATVSQWNIYKQFIDGMGNASWSALIDKCIAYAAAPDKTSGVELLADLNDTYDYATSLISSLDSARCLVLTRNDLVNFDAYKSNVGKVAALSKVFPVFFFCVALLVALTTMTRLVEERRGQIGTLKALGFSNFNILGEFLLYGMLSSVLGCALGLIVGFKLFPAAIASAYSMMFTVPKCLMPFRWEIVAWVAPVTIGSIVVATLWACMDAFVSRPADLMRPKAPQAGKRIWLERIPFVWKRLSFTQKVTCRNLFRYKKRLVMTIVGVAGCTALLLTGFGVRDSVNDIIDKQFGQIYKYDLTVMTKNDGWANDAELLQTIADSGSKYLPVCDVNADIRFGSGKQNVIVCVPQQESQVDFDNFIALRTRKSGDKIAFPTDGVVLTEKLAETLGVLVGDEVSLQIDGVGDKTKVVGITENYVSAYCYMSESVYRTLFDVAPDYTSLLVASGSDVDEQSFMTELMAFDSVLYVNSSATLRNNFDKSIGSINGVILVLILAAGLLSMVVLYNLTNVNICERRKELATIRVLGFHKKEVQNYIFREINILSFVGSLVGLVLGVFLHAFVVKTVEVDQVMFGRDIYVWSYFISLAISILFTLLVNLVMRHKIDGVDMVEAMKATE